MEFVEALWKNSRWECWTDGIRWAVWVIGGAFLPIWTTILILTLYAKDWDLIVLYDQGEFALYAASFMSASLYIVTKTFRRKSFPGQSALTVMSFLLLVTSALVYAVVQSVVLVPEIASVVSLDINFLGLFSWVAMPVAVVFSMLVIVVENIRLGADVKSARKRDLHQLNKEFDALEDNTDE